MIPLFNKNSLTILESLSFTRTLYAFDFDGTLSKIVDTPSEATLHPTTTKLLKHLCDLAPVAVISGRSIEDLKLRMPFLPPYLVGNHGLEGLGKGDGSLKLAEDTCSQWLNSLEKINFGPGVDIENKIYSLAIHYRRSRNKKQAKGQIADALLGLSPMPRLIGGKSVINILPADAPHKGAAMITLMNQLQMKHAFYIGDDDTDEDVFGLPESQIISVRVGKKKVSRAKYFIERQSQINKVLETIIRFHLKA